MHGEKQKASGLPSGMHLRQSRSQSQEARQLYTTPPLEHLLRLPAGVFVNLYFARSNARKLRPIPFSGRVIDCIQGENVWSLSPSILNERSCSVPTDAGFQEASTLTMNFLRFSLESRLHLNEFFVNEISEDLSRTFLGGTFHGIDNKLRVVRRFIGIINTRETF